MEFWNFPETTTWVLNEYIWFDLIAQVLRHTMIWILKKKNKKYEKKFSPFFYSFPVRQNEGI